MTINSRSDLLRRVWIVQCLAGGEVGSKLLSLAMFQQVIQLGSLFGIYSSSSSFRYHGFEPQLR